MFERYTEPARRSIFFARYEASMFGSDYIETEHLLLGLLRENAPMTIRFVGSDAKVEAIRMQIQKHYAERPAKKYSVDLPLSHECKRALAYGAEEAERLNQKQIGPEHLLSGLCRAEKSAGAKYMVELGLTVEKLKQEAEKAAESTAARASETLSPIEKASRDLSAAARAGQLGPLVGREREVERALQILYRRTRNNPALIGESGVGKTAILEGLAQRIVDSGVASTFANRPILAIDATQLIAPRGPERKPFQLTTQGNVILCIEGLFDLAGTGSGWAVTEAIRILEPHLSHGIVQCIATGTPAGLRQTLDKAEALARHFEVIQILPPDESETLQIIETRKEQLARFHRVIFGDGAIETAVTVARQFLFDRQLPERVIDLLDEAGARAKLRCETEPAEIVAARQRIRRVQREMENAIGNHDFEAARKWAEEEKTEREILAAFQEKFKQSAPSNVVTPDDIVGAAADRANASIVAVRKVLEQGNEEELTGIVKAVAGVVPEGSAWIPFLAAYLAGCTPDDLEKLIAAIRAAKGRN